MWQHVKFGEVLAHSKKTQRRVELKWEEEIHLSPLLFIPAKRDMIRPLYCSTSSLSVFSSLSIPFV